MVSLEVELPASEEVELDHFEVNFYNYSGRLNFDLAVSTCESTKVRRCEVNADLMTTVLLYFRVSLARFGEKTPNI